MGLNCNEALVLFSHKLTAVGLDFVHGIRLIRICDI